jgi:hypothetical protein
MTTSEDIEKFIKKTGLETKTEMNEVVRNRIFRAFEKSKQTKSAPTEPNIWRIIMKSRITKLAAAVVIIIAAVMATSLWERSTPTAYAVEQTVEAMRKVTTVRCVVTTITGEQIKMWIKVNPETGENDHYYMDSPDKTVVSTPGETYMYHKGKNVVIHLKGGGHVVSQIRFGRFIEDMVDAAKSINGQVKIKSHSVDGEKPVILLMIETDELTLESKVDSDTKLPMSMNLKYKGKPQPGHIGQSIDEMCYDLPLPEGIFEFEIPEGAEVIE